MLRRTGRWRGPWAVGVGVLLLLGGKGLVTLAEARDLPSGLAAPPVPAVPLWVVLLRTVTGDRPARRTLAGVRAPSTGRDGCAAT